MGYKLDRSSHSVYSLNYHFVQCIKYRRKVLDNEKIIDELKRRVYKISEIYDVDIISMETDLDHIHILFKTNPNINLIKYINNLKSSTSKSIRYRFIEIKKKLWKGVFWSNSYCLITTGQTTLEQIKKYVDSQGK